MALIEVLVMIVADGKVAPSDVRVFLDLVPNGGLSSEIEVPLERRRTGEFAGSFSLPTEVPTSFFYRVGIRASVGAVWTLSFRPHGQRRELLCDSDSLATGKIWLAGSCPVRLSTVLTRARVWRPRRSEAELPVDRERPRLRLV